jgi:acyl carrier protein phosphodiesterase
MKKSRRFLFVGVAERTISRFATRAQSETIEMQKKLPERLDRLEIHLKQEREERTGDLICNRYMQIKVCADVKSAQEKIKQRITQPNPIELDVRELKNHTRVLAALHILHVCRECTSARTLGACIEKSFL